MLNIVAARRTNAALKTLRRTVLRAPVVLLTALAWLAISNHCAIAEVEGAARMPMPGCHGSSPGKETPAKHDQKSAVECCKILRATLLAPSTNLAAYDTNSFAPRDYIVALISVADESRLTRLIERDTGPPAADSFAESVLQRSILAHAPPFLS